MRTMESEWWGGRADSRENPLSRIEKSHGASHADAWGKNIPDTGKSKLKSLRSEHAW